MVVVAIVDISIDIIVIVVVIAIAIVSVTIESYFFLINIIVEPGVPWPPPVYLTKLMFSVLTCNKPLTKR